MNKHHEKQLARLEGIGTTHSVSPPIKQLHEQALAMRASGATEEELKAWLEERMVDHPEFGLLAFFGINRKLGRMSLATPVTEIGKHLASKVKKRRVRDAFLDWMRSSNLNHFVVDYILRWTIDEQPPPLKESDVRWVGHWRYGRDEDAVTIVTAMCSSMSDPRLVAQEFIEECYRGFPAETFERRGLAARDALRFKRFAERWTDFDIAKAELADEGWPDRAASLKEYHAEIATRANSVTVTRARWDDYLTGLLDI